MLLIAISRLFGSTSGLFSAEATKRVRIEIPSFHMPLKGCLHYYVYCRDPEVTTVMQAYVKLQGKIAQYFLFY